MRTKNKKDWVLFINYNAYPCKIGGLEIFNFHLINKLSESCNTHVLTFCNSMSVNENITTHIINIKKYLRLTVPLYTLFFLIKNRKRIKKIHVSYTHGFWSYIFIFFLQKKILNLDYLVTIHDGNLSPWKPKWPYKLFFNSARIITGVSHDIIEAYEKRLKRSDIVYTPPLIPFNIILPKNKFRKQWSCNEDDIVLLYVGSLKPLKSVETLIEALNVISIEKLKLYKLKVLIAGDGVSRESLQNQVTNLKLNDIVSFLGNVDQNQVNQLYNIADFYTICSIYEGLPISLLEAFANGLPTITSDAPSLKNISSEHRNTLIFKTKDSFDYAKKIEQLLVDSELKEQLRNNGKKYYEKQFSYDKLIENFRLLLDD